MRVNSNASEHPTFYRWHSIIRTTEGLLKLYIAGCCIYFPYNSHGAIIHGAWNSSLYITLLSQLQLGCQSIVLYWVYRGALAAPTTEGCVMPPMENAALHLSLALCSPGLPLPLLLVMGGPAFQPLLPFSFFSASTQVMQGDSDETLGHLSCLEVLMNPLALPQLSTSPVPPQ